MKLPQNDIRTHWDRLYIKQFRRGGYIWSEEPSEFIVNRIEEYKKLGVKRVLDIGCGDGRNMLPFWAKGIACAGIDGSQEAINLASKNLSGLGFKNVSFYLENFDDIEIVEKFDLLISAKVFKHYWSLEKILPRLLGLLNPGGYILFEFASLEDSSHDKCQKDGEKQEGYRYLHKSGTRYRFHSKKELEEIFKDLKDLKIEKMEYWDDPHTELSTEKHKHVSWIVTGMVK